MPDAPGPAPTLAVTAPRWWAVPGERPRLPGDAAAGPVDGCQRVASRPGGDDCGEPYALVAVRIGPVWTDSVAIVGEDQTLAMRHRTNDDRLILPTEPPSESRAVWRRHGRCEDVLAELFELP